MMSRRSCLLRRALWYDILDNLMFFLFFFWGVGGIDFPCLASENNGEILTILCLFPSTRASLRLVKRLNFSINPRKLSIFFEPK